MVRKSRFESVFKGSARMTAPSPGTKNTHSQMDRGQALMKSLGRNIWIRWKCNTSKREQDSVEDVEEEKDSEDDDCILVDLKRETLLRGWLLSPRVTTSSGLNSRESPSILNLRKTHLWRSNTHPSNVFSFNEPRQVFVDSDSFSIRILLLSLSVSPSWG